MSFPRYVPIKRVPSRIFHSIDVGDVFFCVKGVKKDAISNVSDGCRGRLADFGAVDCRLALGGGEMSRDTEVSVLFILLPRTSRLARYTVYLTLWTLMMTTRRFCWMVWVLYLGLFRVRLQLHESMSLDK